MHLVRLVKLCRNNEVLRFSCAASVAHFFIWGEKMSKEINKRLAYYRKLSGYSQTQLAEILGMKISTYSQRERTGQLTAGFIIQVSQIFGVDPSVILTGKEGVKFPVNEDDRNDEDNGVIPFYLDNKEKEMLTLWRNLSSTQKREVFAFAYNVFKKK